MSADVTTSVLGSIRYEKMRLREEFTIQKKKKEKNKSKQKSTRISSFPSSSPILVQLYLFTFFSSPSIVYNYNRARVRTVVRREPYTGRRTRRRRRRSRTFFVFVFRKQSLVKISLRSVRWFEWNFERATWIKTLDESPLYSFGKSSTTKSIVWSR